MKMVKLLAAAGLAVAGFAAALTAPVPVRAADHGDAPNIDSDSGADIADVYFFLDPNNNERVILIGTVHGFITPGQATNFGTFDEHILYRFAIENTGDAKPDTAIDVTFTPRTSGTGPQTATVVLPGKKNTFTALTTPPNVSTQPTSRAITTDTTNDVRFFAGITDDPFFFDLVGFQRFVASVLGGNPNPALLQRGRDVFAGYDIMSIALDMPKSLIRGADTNNEVGVEFITLRKTESVKKDGTIKSSGKFVQKDRMGNPGVNTAFLPFGRKSAFNGATPLDDAKGAFAQDITNTLNALGVDSTHQQILAGLVITRGDYLRLDLSKPNTGTGGGDNIPSQYPNGRRLKDDVIDIILTVVANGDPTTRPFALGDAVDANDLPFLDQFPFLALPQQPRDNGVIDDNTRN